MMTQYQLTMTEEQAKVIQDACELYFRMDMGQLTYLTEHIGFMARNYDQQLFEEKLLEARNVVMSDLHGMGHSYGVRNEKFILRQRLHVK